MLRQQLSVLCHQRRRRVGLENFDRVLPVWLYRPVPAFLNTTLIVQPETVIGWHRRGFRVKRSWQLRNRGGRSRG